MTVRSTIEEQCRHADCSGDDEAFRSLCLAHPDAVVAYYEAQVAQRVWRPCWLRQYYLWSWITDFPEKSLVLRGESARLAAMVANLVRLLGPGCPWDPHDDNFRLAPGAYDVIKAYWLGLASVLPGAVCRRFLQETGDWNGTDRGPFGEIRLRNPIRFRMRRLWLHTHGVSLDVDQSPAICPPLPFVPWEKCLA